MKNPCIKCVCGHVCTVWPVKVCERDSACMCVTQKKKRSLEVKEKEKIKNCVSVGSDKI